MFTLAKIRIILGKPKPSQRSRRWDVGRRRRPKSRILTPNMVIFIIFGYICYKEYTYQPKDK